VIVQRCRGAEKVLRFSRDACAEVQRCRRVEVQMSRCPEVLRFREEVKVQQM
jgi:hypothetical protein